MSDIEIIPTPRVMLSITDAARCLSVGRSTMYELINSGAIETVHIGRLRRDIGWEPEYTFASMVEQTYEWWRGQGLDRSLQLDFAFEDQLLAHVHGSRR